MMNRSYRQISLIAVTVAAILGAVLIERTFAAITEGLEAAVEVSQVSAEAAGSIDELSAGIGSLIDSVDDLTVNAQSVSSDASSAANGVADAADGSVGQALTATAKTTEKLAPVVGAIEKLTGNRGTAKELEALSKSLKPLPKELDGIAANLRSTAKSLDATWSSLDQVRKDLATTKASVDRGRTALTRLPSAAKKAESAASAPLQRLKFTVWLWRIALFALWLAAVASIIGKGRIRQP